MNEPKEPADVDLYWLPLGAAGTRCASTAACSRPWSQGSSIARHATSLEVRVPEDRFVIEMTAVPDSNGAARGVAVGGARSHVGPR